MPHCILFIIAPCGLVCGERWRRGGGGGAECRIIILEWFIILPRSQNLFFVINKKTNKNKYIF